jgi:hypothetical protein
MRNNSYGVEVTQKGLCFLEEKNHRIYHLAEETNIISDVWQKKKNLRNENII